MNLFHNTTGTGEKIEILRVKIETDAPKTESSQEMCSVLVLHGSKITKPNHEPFLRNNTVSCILMHVLQTS